MRNRIVLPETATLIHFPHGFTIHSAGSRKLLCSDLSQLSREITLPERNDVRAPGTFLLSFSSPLERTRGQPLFPIEARCKTEMAQQRSISGYETFQSAFTQFPFLLPVFRRMWISLVGPETSHTPSGSYGSSESKSCINHASGDSHGSSESKSSSVALVGHHGCPGDPPTL